MALNLASPGVKIREVDLTIGRVDPGNEQVGAIAGPFSKGPVNIPTLVSNEQELLEFFGKPIATDGQSEYWLSASNYLSYGGSLRIIRCSGENLNNANSAIGYASTTLKIDNFEDYENNHKNDTTWTWASKNPGSWSNGLKVCVIDNAADQIISGITTAATPAEVFTEVTTSTADINATATTLTGVNTTGIATGQYVRSLLGGVFDNTTVVSGITSTSDGLGNITITPASLNPIGLTSLSVRFGTVATVFSGEDIEVGYSISQSLYQVIYATGAGTTASFSGKLRGIITEVKEGSISVKIVDRIDNNDIVTAATYSPNSDLNSFRDPSSSSYTIRYPSGIATVSSTDGTISDWYDQQTLGLTNSTVYWKSIAPKPSTSQWSAERSGKNDEMHVVVVDDLGSVTGISGNILEKYISVSKASDGRVIPSQANYYKDVIASESNYVYAGFPESGASSSLTQVGSSNTAFTASSGVWGSEAQGTAFDVAGAKVYSLTGGADYSGNNNIGGYSVQLTDVVSAYQTLNNAAEYPINFIISGPSGGSTIYESQAKANALISLANLRKDCIACISPHRSGIVNVSDSTTQTNNAIQFFSALTGSSYAVFDSGYKYMFDRFNNKFEYVACNADIAGLMARTSINNFSWFSPAGTARGSINNAVKLAYNPSPAQRDELYTNRINPIISTTGSGFILFGDKTAIDYASAFDRINVRRLFLTLERSIESAARDQLFEFNDIITRTNFINIVDPFLRDVQAKRGISDYQLICDESNNTPDVIDAGEFRADIYVQPARSINFIGLTFVATRTGISFAEVTGAA